MIIKISILSVNINNIKNKLNTDNINIKVATENFISQSDGPTIL